MPLAVSRLPLSALVWSVPGRRLSHLSHLRDGEESLRVRARVRASGPLSAGLLDGSAHRRQGLSQVRVSFVNLAGHCMECEENL